MNKIKKGIALLLCAVMCIPNVSVFAESVPETAFGESVSVQDDRFSALTASIAEQTVKYNTGRYEYCVADEAQMNALAQAFLQKYGVSVGDTDGYADNEDAVADARELEHYVVSDSQKVQIPVEKNAFFPYEVQFSCHGETWSEWFMTKDDTVQAGEYEFSLLVPAGDADVLTQISLNVGGDTVAVYPQKKEFTNEEGGQASEISLLPLKEVKLTAPLLNYTPVELTKVSFQSILTGASDLPSNPSVIWYKNERNGSRTDYQIASIGDTIDLSRTSSLEIIAGKPDQLAADNIRYLLDINYTNESHWLIPSICMNDKSRDVVWADYRFFQGEEYDIENKNWKDIFKLDMEIKEEEAGENSLVCLKLNPDYVKGADFSIRIFEGEWTEASLKDAAVELTDRMWNKNVTAAGNGYELPLNEGKYITIVSYKNHSEITGCMPVKLEIKKELPEIQMGYHLYKQDDDGYRGQSVDSFYSTSYHTYENMLEIEYIFELKSGYPANGNYLAYAKCSKNGIDDSSRSDLFAYAGRYASVKAAEAAKAVNIKDSLFADGYKADYSQGVSFSIFLGRDDDPKRRVYHYRVKAIEKSGEGSAPPKNSSTEVEFQKILAGSESALADTKAYFAGFDSYGDNNFYVYFIDRKTEDGTEIELNHLALEFFQDKGVTLYQGKDSTGSPVESKKTFLDFSKGMVQLTAVSENKENSQNYFIRVLQANDMSGAMVNNDVPELFVNSLDDEMSGTNIGEDGIRYSKREVMLDAYKKYQHDILVINTTVTTMSALKAVLDSDYLEMDEYWDLKGGPDSNLAGFTSAEKTAKFGKLPNLAMLRLKAKDSHSESKEYDNLGTITFTSGSRTLLKLNLSGMIGNPRITTEDKDIAPATKYVPYGTVIQNNNKYKRNKVSYSLYDGKLPNGMILAESGELYGVPMETGDFSFTVKMDNSYRGLPSSIKTLHITVRENTDANVEDAQDDGYELDIKISDIYDTDADGNYQIRSIGLFKEFYELYIDGDQLKKGTDYWAEEGSTRITIAAQALKKTPGTHTIGVEFHKDQKDRNIRAGAQNYVVGSGSSSAGGSPGGSPGGSSSGSYYPGSSGASATPVKPGGSSQGTAPSGPDNSSQPVTPSEPVVPSGPVTPSEPETPEPPVSKVMRNAKKCTVKDGDTLMSIAKKYYGRAGLWKRIYDANKDSIPASKKLKKGMKLIIPALSYTVKEGDTLKSIAKKYFGGQSKWKQIYGANRDVISSSKELKTGDKLVIPVPVCRTIYQTQKGDTLEGIAEEFYGDAGRWKMICDANKNKVSSSASKKVKAGRMLLIPAMSYTVKKGDTTKSIAKKYYGAQSKWKIVYDANKDVIPTSQKIETGDKFVLPVPLCRTVYTVQAGDTLESISQRFYGKGSKWKKIYNANTNKISASKKVKAGRKLIIPALNCTAGKGDDLKSIARKYYGTKKDWTKIYQVNRDVIPASRKLNVGMKLVIPVPAEI